MGTRKFTPTVEWEDARQVRGLLGEHAAMAYLISCGWSIEAHRFRLGRHDVDLIARKGHVVAFIEVKTRRGGQYGAPAEAIDRKKQGTIAKVADLWRLRFGRPADEYRFDAVLVHEDPGGSVQVEHVENGWQMSR